VVVKVVGGLGVGRYARVGRLGKVQERFERDSRVWGDVVVVSMWLFSDATLTPI